MSRALHVLQGEMANRLDQIGLILPRGCYKLTLVCRYVGPEQLDADIVLTNDDPKAAAKAIAALAGDSQ